MLGQKVSDFGFKEQFDLFNYLKNNTGEFPLVVDADDLRNNTKETLIKLCNGLNIEWDPLMLSWEPGLKEYDGVWAKHWYKSVENSTGFASYTEKQLQLNDEQLEVVNQVQPFYQQLYDKRIIV